VPASTDTTEQSHRYRAAGGARMGRHGTGQRCAYVDTPTRRKGKLVNLIEVATA